MLAVVRRLILRGAVQGLLPLAAGLKGCVVSRFVPATHCLKIKAASLLVETASPVVGNSFAG